MPSKHRHWLSFSIE
ncbi:hypothetical protein ACHAXN_009489 [Cyclotella atomus]